MFYSIKTLDKFRLFFEPYLRLFCKAIIAIILCRPKKSQSPEYFACAQKTFFGIRENLKSVFLSSFVT